MTITIYSGFSKRINSTKRPAANTGTGITAQLKAPTSIDTPTFRLQRTDDDINYVYVSSWGHYYFVTSLTYITADIIEITCAVDVLATYKSRIGSYSGMIEYAADSTELLITDERNKPTYSIITGYSADTVLSGLSTTGYFIVGVMNSDSSPGITYYAMSQSQLADLKGAICDTSIWNQIALQFNSINDAICSCIWVPFTVTGLSSCLDIETTVKIGDKLLNTGGHNVRGRRLISRTITSASTNINLTFPAHTAYSIGHTYLDYAPYTTGVLYLPFVGCIDLPLDVAAPITAVIMSCSVDIATGDIVYAIRKTASDILATYSGNCGTKVPLNAQSYDAIGTSAGVVTAIGGVVASVLTGNPTPLVASLGAVPGVAKSATIHSMLHGGISSAVGATLGLQVIAMIITRVPTVTDLDSFAAEQGMPYFKVSTIGSHAGYIKCNNASVEIAGMSDDKDAVNNYLNNGFYYE